MRGLSMGLAALALIGVTGCDIEAGSNSNFPPIGGAPAPIALPPITFLPADQPTTEEEMTASLSEAVGEALAATEAIAPVHPVTAQPPVNPATVAGIASDDGILNLSLQSQEEQRIARDADAAALQAAAAQRIVIAPGQLPEVIANVNIVAYARNTSNAVGERVVQRPAIRRSNSRQQCARFDSPDNAQRNFLANGGPQEDPLNLDPDGDGFACSWSPDAYRALDLN